MIAGLSNLVVEVLHNRGDDNHPDWSVGSGFFVGTRQVLTALHNVNGPGELLVRLHGTEERPAVVRLQGDKDRVDLAVLEVSDVAVDVPPLRYGAVDRSASAVVERCWAVGFPRFKERVPDPKPLRLSAQVNGEIPTGENLDQPLLTLQVRRSPRPLPSSAVRESEWAGMSGATVFSGNNIIVGVITEHHLPEGESALTVVPITALDLLPEAEATKWWKLLGVDHQALVRLPGEAPSSLSHVERQNRTRLMKRVRTTWIEGVLEHSLYQATLIALDLQEQPDALANPWHFEVQETDRSPRPLPGGTSIVQVYDEAEGELLILGEPGVGKTTLLLELARTLLQRAEGGERHRLPVVFHLSSWAQEKERQPLAKWLVEELTTKYQVPRKPAQVWVNTDQILPLLDGLDEVTSNVRAACVDAINVYHQEHMVPLIVCSRKTEYFAQTRRLTLRDAVIVRPLTAQQIDDYLSNAGGQLAAVRVALTEDKELQELATTPLMLNVLMLAYQGRSTEDLLMEGSLETRRRQIFAVYVERMLTRRGVSKHVSREQTLRWLTFLAAGMQKHHRTTFFSEDLEPDWLADRRIQLLYRLSVWLPVGLVTLLFAWPVWLVSGLFTSLVNGPVISLVTRLVYGLGIGLVTSLIEGPVGWLVIRLIVGLIAVPFVLLIIGLIDLLIEGPVGELPNFPANFALRFWLSRANCLPRNVTAFLDEAAERLLLRRVGSRYIFIHRLLLDYFASLETKES